MTGRQAASDERLVTAGANDTKHSLLQLDLSDKLAYCALLTSPELRARSHQSVLFVELPAARRCPLARSTSVPAWPRTISHACPSLMYSTESQSLW
eukprot:COSAG06_NODE_152_length_21942_cov_4.593234_3_plen_96_part_00